MNRAPTRSSPDVLLVSLGTTAGLRRSDEALAALMREVGVRVQVVAVGVGTARRFRRAQPAIDLIEAMAARRAAGAALARTRPRAIVFSTVTASLLQPGRIWTRHRVAVRFDSPAAINRPGVRNAPQRALERRAFDRAALLLPLGEAGRVACGGSRAVVLPVPLEDERQSEPGRRGTRDPHLAVAYAADPQKRGLEMLLSSWIDAAIPGARLIVCGIDADRAARYMPRGATLPLRSVEFRGLLHASEFEGLLARAQLFLNASLREDYGQSQLEALAAGAMLVTVPSPGCYEALPLARRLAPELVADQLSPRAFGAAISAGFGTSGSAAGRYRESAGTMLEPYRRDAVRRTLESEVLPRLLEG